MTRRLFASLAALLFAKPARDLISGTTSHITDGLTVDGTDGKTRHYPDAWYREHCEVLAIMQRRMEWANTERPNGLREYEFSGFVTALDYCHYHDYTYQICERILAAGRGEA
jgi:hypothetical protein